MPDSQKTESTTQAAPGTLENSSQATTDSTAEPIMTETSLAKALAPPFLVHGETSTSTFTQTVEQPHLRVTAQQATVTPVTLARNGIALTKEDAKIVDACSAAMQAVDLSSRKFGQDSEALYQIGTTMVEKYKDQGHSGKHRTGLTLRDVFAAAGWSYDAWRQWKSRMLAVKKFVLHEMKGLGKKEKVKAITGDTLMDVNTKKVFKVDYILSDMKAAIKKDGETVEVELYDKDLIPAYENVTPKYTALVRGKDYRSGKDGIVVRLVRFDKEGMPIFEKRTGRTQADIDEANKNDRLAMKAARKVARDEAKKKEQEAKQKREAEAKLGLQSPGDKDRALIAAAQAKREAKCAGAADEAAKAAAKAKKRSMTAQVATPAKVKTFVTKRLDHPVDDYVFGTFNTDDLDTPLFKAKKLQETEAETARLNAKYAAKIPPATSPVEELQSREIPVQKRVLDDVGAATVY